MINEIKNINIKLEAMKCELELYIADKSIPLDTRWEVFCEATDSLKDRQSYIVTFEWEQTYRTLEWYNTFNYDKYTTVKMIEVIDYMQDSESYGVKFPERSIIDLKEEILDKNLHSFILDW